MQGISVNTNRLKTDFEPVVLSQTQNTRVVLKAEKFPDSGLRLKLVHQKGSKHWEADFWTDEARFQKSTLKQGEFVDFELNTLQTKKLLEALPKLAEFAELPLEYGDNEFLIMKGREREVLEQLFAENGDELWQIFDELKPGFIHHLAIIEELEKRQKILNNFQRCLEQEVWQESDWQQFFAENTWIFGHGLDYRILDSITGQAHYGGITVTGKGQQVGDYIMSTRANARFTILVEIKKPQSLLVKEVKYRNGAYAMGSELTGGVSQLQVNCRSWNRTAQEDGNRDFLEEENIYTCEPKGILIIGNTKQLSQNRNMRNTFELFRRNLHNPEVLTFDELYERASFIVSNLEKSQADLTGDLEF